MNNQNTSSWLQIHHVYTAHYQFQQTDTICDESSSLLGCVHMTILYFNAALSVGTEGTSNGNWDLRKEKFQSVADAVELNYGKFGSTEAGRDTKSVRSILGTLYISTLVWLNFSNW